MANLDKLVYEVRKQVGAISDDRYLDARYITYLIGKYRADLLRKKLSRQPYYETTGAVQYQPLELVPVSKSVFPQLDLSCKVLRSKKPVSKLLYEEPNSNWFRVVTADITRNTIETISVHRAPYLSFEFDVAYSFLAAGKEADPDGIEKIDEDYYLYVIAKDSMELRFAIVVGVFEDPYDVNPDMDDYPIKMSDWAIISPEVVNYILGKVPPDPLNNSEPDEGGRRPTETATQQPREEA